MWKCGKLGAANVEMWKVRGCKGGKMEMWNSVINAV